MRDLSKQYISKKRHFKGVAFCYIANNAEKNEKKFIRLLSGAMVLVLFTSLFSMVSFATIEPNVVAEYRFSSSTEGWSLFSGDWGESLTLMQGVGGGEDKCLAIEEHNKAWESPQIDIGDIIRANGAGTYGVYAKVKTSKYKAAYNFIKNLQNGNNDLIDYFESDKNQ